MDEPESPTGTVAVRTGGGPSARLAVAGFLAIVIAVVALSRIGPDDAPGRPPDATMLAAGSVAPGPSSASIPAVVARSAAADPIVVRGTRVGTVDVTDPTPGASVPGTGLLGISGRVLTYRPDRVVARLVIPGRRDVVGSLGPMDAGSFSGWLSVAAPSVPIDAVLELYDGQAQLAPRRPLATIAFRLDPPPPVTIDRPAVPFQVIDTRDLLVGGTVDPRVRQILVTLEARNNRVIERAVVAVGTSAGDPAGSRRDGSPRVPWSVRLDLPAPHPNGTMVIEVMPLDGVADPDRYRLRLPVTIGALAP